MFSIVSRIRYQTSPRNGNCMQQNIHIQHKNHFLKLCGDTFSINAKQSPLLGTGTTHQKDRSDAQTDQRADRPVITNYRRKESLHLGSHLVKKVTSKYGLEVTGTKSTLSRGLCALPIAKESKHFNSKMMS